MPYLCLGHEGPAGELEAIVGTNRTRIAPGGSGLIQQPGYILAGDAKVGGKINALVTKVVRHRRAFDASTIGQAVADKIHTPFLDLLRNLERYPLSGRRLGLLPLLPLLHR